MASSRGASSRGAAKSPMASSSGAAKSSMASSRGAVKSPMAYDNDPEACNLLWSSMHTYDRVRKNFWTKQYAPGTKSFMFDKNTAPYNWLMTGWLAEERTVASGQVYKFYYDPTGSAYNSKKEVLLAWKEAGYIVIDQ